MTQGMNRAAGVASLALTLAIAGAGAAFPQVETKSKAPIDSSADTSEIINSKCMVILRGAAEVLQGESRLRADTITIYAHPKGTGGDGRPACAGADRIVADGHVYYVSGAQIAHGDQAVYNQADDQIVMTGNVIVVQGLDVARGDRLTIKVSTKDAKLESDVTGAGKPGRVRGVYYPDKTNPEAGPAKPADAPK